MLFRNDTSPKKILIARQISKDQTLLQTKYILIQYLTMQCLKSHIIKNYCINCIISLHLFACIGPGILDHFDDTLSWNTTLLDLNVVFEIMVVIIKDVRRGNFSLFVEVKVGDPPQAAIK